MPVKRIAILLEDGADLLDIAGPAGVFHCAGRHFVWTGASHVGTYDLHYLSLDGGPIRTRQELTVQTASLKDAEQAEFDTVIVVGTDKTTSDACAPELLDWIRDCPGAVRRLGSVCVGAFTLASAGLLDGRRATTHWEDCAELAARFPKVQVEPDAIYTEDGGIWTGAGVSAGIDLALAMVEQDHGHEVALLVARRQVVFLKRPGGQSQFSVHLQQQKRDHALAPLLQWIVENPRADLRSEALADRANMSLRTFYRSFVAAAGSPPADWVESARLEVAKRLLEDTQQTLEQIAVKSGFGSYERMRRSFARRLGTAPSGYRARFSRPCAGREQSLDLLCMSEGYALDRGSATPQ